MCLSLEYCREKHAIDFTAGQFLRPIFIWGNETINPNITELNITQNSHMLDPISEMNAAGNGYSTDFIWVTSIFIPSFQEPIYYSK